MHTFSYLLPNSHSFSTVSDQAYILLSIKINTLAPDQQVVDYLVISFQKNRNTVVFVCEVIEL